MKRKRKTAAKHYAAEDAENRIQRPILKQKRAKYETYKALKSELALSTSLKYYLMLA